MQQEDRSINSEVLWNGRLIPSRSRLTTLRKRARKANSVLRSLICTGTDSRNAIAQIRRRRGVAGISHRRCSRMPGLGRLVSLQERHLLSRAHRSDLKHLSWHLGISRKSLIADVKRSPFTSWELLSTYMSAVGAVSRPIC